MGGGGAPRGGSMLEIDVTVTDYVLAAECLFCAVWSWRKRCEAWRGYVVFFGSLSLAALAGGTAHGYFPAKSGLVGMLVWQVVLASIGLTAVSMAAISWQLTYGNRKRSFLRIVLLGYSIFLLGIASGWAQFSVALAACLPATILLASVYYRRWRQRREHRWLFGLSGIALTLVAAGVQIGRIVIHPLYFNHNACYHAIQAIALGCIAWGSWADQGGEETRHAGSS